MGDKKYQATIQFSFSFQTKGMYNVHRDSEMRKVGNLENQFVLIFFHSALNNRRLPWRLYSFFGAIFPVAKNALELLYVHFSHVCRVSQPLRN